MRHEGELVWVAARAEWSPPFDFIELPSAAAVDALGASPHGDPAAYCWAWIDEGAGLIRARGFAPEEGVPEDEATGSAALALCARLGREIEVRQGVGSVLHARPLADGWAEVGGCVALDEVRDFHA